ncbi:MAG: gluconate 2-dehydrogenase subunit 3 family protein [Thermoanaerobaculia bacterium]|nr:gluconate 2-dehydrogenase subunit 3 family protein [Thermoanaerobaculia bacterium]
MNRREAIQRVAILMGGSLLGADSLLANNINWDAMDDADYSKDIGIFSKGQIKLMNEVADTILPTTNTPGAKTAKVGQFIAVIVSDCYKADEQKRFVDGLATLDQRCKQKYGKNFMRCSKSQRHDYLVELDKEQKEPPKDKKNGEPPVFFKTFKDLTVWGYFTSEIGCTQALRMVEIPGRYEGCTPYQKGERAWGGY